MPPRLLPLFPLSVVLLPHTPLPLHIFEDRYKQMMADILPDQEFGVVLAKDEGIVNIGCTATVEQVLERHADGRLDLVALGRRRFRITSLDEELAYLRAEIEYAEESDAEPPPAELKQRAFDACTKLRAVESPNVISEPSLEDAGLSFELGQFISDLEKKQILLSLDSEIERLTFLVGMLPEYTAGRQQAMLARRLAPLNGHARHIKEP